MRHVLQVQDIIDWTLTEGRRFASPTGLLSGIATRLRAAGVPVDRATLHLPTVHPQLYALGYIWLSETGETSERQLARKALTSTYFHSPVGMLHRTGAAVRRRLTGQFAELDFPLLEELADEGFTDYLILPLDIGRPTVSGFGFMTKAEGGFSAEQIDMIMPLLIPIATVIELYVARRTATGLLGAYVGHEAGKRILDGDVVVGSGRTIDAILLFTDMRNFTTLSEELERQPLLDLLGDYFNALIGPIDRAGGEVLKFLGDGLLAIFNLEGETSEDEACARAMIAAFEAERAVHKASLERERQGRARLECGIALHRGNVIYGNIGAGDRLDFTVVGPAVNRAARIEEMTRSLGRPILTSRAFARACPVELISLGKHQLKGVDRAQELFAPGTALVDYSEPEPDHVLVAS